MNTQSVTLSDCSPHPPLHGHGTDVPPASVQAAGGLLDRVVLGVAAAGIGIVEQDVTKRQHRRHALRVLLDVPLQILITETNHGLEGKATWTHMQLTYWAVFTHHYIHMLGGRSSLTFAGFLVILRFSAAQINHSTII